MAMHDKVNIKTSSTQKHLSDSAKNKKHQELVWTLKETFKPFELNPIDSGLAKIMKKWTKALPENFPGIA